MEFFETLIDQVKREEGFSSIPYEDSEGHLTIGYGHLLDKKGITTPIAYAILKQDLLDALADLEQNKPWWKDLPQPARLVVADMCFNLGWSKFAKFVRFWAALEKRDYQMAANEMRDSLWYRQVKTRGVKLATMMETTLLTTI